MAIRTPITVSGTYFVTFTCFQWMPLFEITSCYDFVYKWFEVLKNNGHSIIGYVIMPNHMHLIMHYKKKRQSLNTIIGNCKRFMAYEIVKKLNQKSNRYYIEQLSLAVQISDKLKGSKHEVWENSFDVRPCFEKEFLLQKLNYIHNNPCSKGWKLVETPEQYPHSSAFYNKQNKSSHQFITHYSNFF